MNKLFAKIASLTLGLALVAGAGVALASHAEAKGVRADDPYYTLDTTGTLKGSNSGYAGNCDIESGAITWNFTGNSTMNPWRLGGKSLSSVARTVYTKTAMSAAITNLDLTVGAASSITVNSLALTVASDADFKTVIDEVSATFAANSKIAFAPTNGESWAENSYYKFTFTVTVSGSSNKFVEFKKVEFYRVAASSPEISFSPASLSFLSTDAAQEVTVTPNDVFSGTPTLSVSGTPSYVNVSVNGLVLTVSPKAVGTESVTINAVYNSQQASASFNVKVLDSHGRTADDPFTVAEARAAIDAESTLQSVYVAGIISQVDEPDSFSGQICYWISDDGTTTNQFEIYWGKDIGNKNFPSADAVEIGASVVNFGNIKKYNSTYEFDSGSYLISYSAPAGQKWTVSFNPGEGSGTMDSVQVSDGKSYTLPACTFTAPEGKVFDHWEVAGVEKTSLESVTADVEVTATWKDAPSEVDATMAPGTNGSAAKVVVSEVEKDAIKVGTSSKGGDMTITVGTGATYVKFYAAAWKGVEGLSLNISGATANPASIDLTADEGIANSSPFTLSGSESSYLFTVVLSNITSETTLTLETSIAKRFVLWGAVYGSGSTPTPPPAETYTVTYDANGGTGSMSDENSPYNSGALVTVLECSFSREGYTFDHWDTKADDSGTDYAEGATFNISANTTLYAQWHENGGGSSTAARVYSLVESESDLVDGAKYIIANTDASVALSTTQNTNNRGQAGIVISEGKAIVSSDSVQVITLEATAVEGKPWALNVGNGYLYAASSSSNNLKTQAENNDNGRWTISISDGAATVTAQGTNTRNILKYNKSSSLFSCYASGQQSISLYRLDFGATLLQNITCDGNGSHEFAEGFDWDDLKAVYGDLPASEQEALVSGSSDGLERYDYLVAKYEYENFVGRTIPSIGRYVPTSNEVDSNTAITIITIIAVTSISAIAVLLVVKKRKTY